MKQKTLEFLEAHQSEMPSTFTEDAKWRQENEVWLKWSHGVAMSKAIFLFRSWINGPGGTKNLHGSYPFALIENRPAPLSFVKLSLSAQIYYFCHTNLGAVNHSANLRFAHVIVASLFTI